ncbi:SbcC/MukB-like Walker B domain-containing protein [Enterococcus xiangfangensis]|uniref:SbcC/MukB-like Walker B domain-containing protein n=1 Tax=Enterococcus xiangfangensis TaxID=1296537 RepID=UPI003D17A3C6|nr:SMC family ATPase [Enterococcus asini]
MLPKKIIMDNFGPFLHEEVDFEEMSEAPLFLISGKTGAGKTTIFDAITFALYGDASGGVRSSNEIRSSFAEPTEETRIQFLFEHQGRNYSIERWPKQTLAKKNGKGETTKNQKVQLSIFDDTGQEAEAYTKVDAVNEVIYQILHLQKDQFRQIVMLPQGEFRTFLNANSTEKETVLRSLFGTSFYRNFTERLKFQKIELEKSVGDLTTRIDQLFQQVAAEKGATYEESLKLAQSYLITEEQTLQTNRAELLEKQAVQKELQQQVQQAQELSERFLQAQATQQQLQQLKENLPEQTEKKKQLAREKAIENLRPLYERVQELAMLQTQQDLSIVEQQRQSAELEQRYVDCQKQEKEFEQQRSDQQAQEKELQSLESFLPLVKRKAELEQQQAELMLKQTHYQTQSAKISERLQTAEKQQQLLASRLNSEQSWQDRRYKELQLKQQVEQLQTLDKQIFDQQEAEENQQIKLAQLVEQASQISNQLTGETAEYKKLKSRWAAAEIARLSMDLLPGEPCPVCGSKEHPEPAPHSVLALEDISQLQATLETQEARIKQLELLREQTEARYEVAIKNFDDAQSERVRAQETFNQQLIQLQTDIQADYQQEVAAELAELINFLIVCQKETTEALAEIAEARQSLELLTVEIAKDQAEKKELETSGMNLTEELQLVVGRLTSIKEQTADWQLPQLEKRIAELNQALEKYQEQLYAHQTVTKELEQQQIRLQEQQRVLTKQQQETAENLGKYQTSLEEKLLESGLVFDQLQAPSADLLLLEKEIAEFDQQLLILTDRHKRLLTAIEDQEKPETEPLQQRLAECEAEVVQLQQHYYAKENQLQQQRELIGAITTLQEKSQEQLAELSQMIQLYQTMNGDNPQKISLERYVLQWYLAEVLQSANQQLNQLTKGRYRFELEHEAGRSKGNTGLEINVYDDNAGASRSSHTLSGGESFIAALSLALGLAEVIQNQAGGIAIETLFIDEGFGSLDEEALEMAMEALEGIENTGRMIGIISHVRELKERIPQQIIVETSGTGRSSIRYQLEGWSET